MQNSLIALCLGATSLILVTFELDTKFLVEMLNVF